MTAETNNPDNGVKLAYMEVSNTFRIEYLNHIFLCSSGSQDSGGTACNGRALWMALKADIQDEQ